jgi:glycosyltransferase involved in cell wall biosynthesis
VLVHDWLTGMRGGEKVLESLCRLFPDADLLTLVHVPGSVSRSIEARRIRTSVVQRLPRPARFYRHYLPFFPTAIELFDLDEADLVVSTSHCAAKAVVAPGRAAHICYCHSPMRYAWDQFDSYFGADRVGAVAHQVFRRVMAALARWDRATAPRVDRFVANSRFVAGRIARYYNRSASVLHPPADVSFFTPEDGDGQGRVGPGFLVVSALVPYKRIDIAIEAARLLDVPLTIVGGGPDEARLRARAGPHVEFTGPLDDESLRDRYRRAQALVMTAEEDFGIVAVEAMACGRPVVALGRGGAAESVEDGVTGLLVREATAEAFAAAMGDCRRRAFDPARARARAEAFSVARFEAGFRALLTDTLAEHAAC